GAPNAAGTVETRALVSNGAVTLNAKVTNKGKRIVRASGKVTQAGAAVAGAQVSLLLNGKLRFRIRSTAAGGYSIVLRKSGKKTTTTFQARTTEIEEHTSELQ